MSRISFRVWWHLYLAVVSVPFETLWSGVSEPAHVLRGFPPLLLPTLIVSAPGILGLALMEYLDRKCGEGPQLRDFVGILVIAVVFTIVSGGLVVVTIASAWGLLAVRDVARRNPIVRHYMVGLLAVLFLNWMHVLLRYRN